MLFNFEDLNLMIHEAHRSYIHAPPNNDDNACFGFPRLLPSAAIDVVGDVVVFSVAVGIPNVFLTRTHSESRNSEGDGASLARNTDYGDGAMMTTANEGKGGEGGEEQCKI